MESFYRWHLPVITTSCMQNTRIITLQIRKGFFPDAVLGAGGRFQPASYL